MEISEFENIITRLLPTDEDGLFLDDGKELLYIWVAGDGCLSAKYKGERIPCEGMSWKDALDVIVKFIIDKEGGSCE